MTLLLAVRPERAEALIGCQKSSASTRLGSSWLSGLKIWERIPALRSEADSVGVQALEHLVSGLESEGYCQLADIQSKTESLSIEDWSVYRLSHESWLFALIETVQSQGAKIELEARRRLLERVKLVKLSTLHEEVIADFYPKSKDRHRRNFLGALAGFVGNNLPQLLGAADGFDQMAEKGGSRAFRWHIPALNFKKALCVLLATLLEDVEYSLMREDVGWGEQALTTLRLDFAGDFPAGVRRSFHLMIDQLEEFSEIVSLRADFSDFLQKLGIGSDPGFVR